jgi:hypothetical protein
MKSSKHVNLTTSVGELDERHKLLSVAIVAFSDPTIDPRVARQIGSLSKAYRLHIFSFAPERLSSAQVKYYDIRPTALRHTENHLQSELQAPRFPYSLKISNWQLANWAYVLIRTVFRILKLQVLLLFFVAQKTRWARNFFMRRLLRKEEVQHLLSSFAKINADLVIANDLDALAVLAEGTKYSGKILFDAHEYAPREFEDILSWRLGKQWFRTYLCEKNIPRANLLTTVCDGIAREYEKQFELQQPALVITNAPAYKNLKPVPSGDYIELIHHGVAIPSRKLENMIATMELLPAERFNLTLMLVYSNEDYMNMLRTLADRINQKAARTAVKFIPPVPMPDICNHINQYDFELIMVPPVNFNYEMGLGNKFFEAIQARIGLAIGPLPEMAKYVRKYDIGIVADTFAPASMAAALAKVSNEDVSRFKVNANRAAKENCAEQNALILQKAVARLLDKRKNEY